MRCKYSVCEDFINGDTELRTKQSEQIKLVKDFSWLNFEALEGLEHEFAEILNSVCGQQEFAIRNKKLCLALRKRIELLKAIVKIQKSAI